MYLIKENKQVFRKAIDKAKQEGDKHTLRTLADIAKRQGEKKLRTNILEKINKI